MTNQAEEKLNNIERPVVNPTEEENEGNHLASILATAYVLRAKGQLTDDEYELIKQGVDLQKEILLNQEQ